MVFLSIYLSVMLQLVYTADDGWSMPARTKCELPYARKRLHVKSQ